MQLRWWAGPILTGMLLAGFSYGAAGKIRPKEKILLRCQSSGAEGSSFKEIYLKQSGEKYFLEWLSSATSQSTFLPIYSAQQTPFGTYYDLGFDSGTNRRMFLVTFRKQAVILYNNDMVLMVNDYQEDQPPIPEQGDSESGDVLSPVDLNQVALVEFLTCS